MAEFLSPTDIGSRALQHCGQPQLGVNGFSEDSVAANAINFCFGKLRQAELRRNPWRFAIRTAALRAIDTTTSPPTMLLAAAMWVNTTTYFVGSIVSDINGNLWISAIPNNLGNEPQTSIAWEPYFGPLTVTPYSATVGYSSGELVYTTAGDGKNRVYLSLTSNNTSNPATATAWDATVNYDKNDVVTYLTIKYMSLIDLNTNQQPSLAPALWSVSTTYGSGASVGGSDGVIYTSVNAGNLGHDPTLDNGTNWTNTGVLNPWTTVFVGGSGAVSWRQIGGAEFPMGVTLAELNLIYPIGSGPSSQLATRNVYRLPAGFLKQAPQDPKAGSISFLGAPGGRAFDDWNFENNYLVSSDIGPIILRFIADVTDISRMDAMFCEGLANRIAREICETITNSSSKHQQIDADYKQTMGEARLINAIEIGWEEAPLDDYISCRA